MKIGICGNGRAGKDHAAKFLAEATGTRYCAGTSYWARHLVFAYYSHHHPGVYGNAEQCWMDRHADRTLWAQIIGDYNRDDPVRLYRDCLQDQEFLTGVRFRNEFEAVKKSGIVDLWLYVDKPGTKDPTNQIRPEDCDITIHNFGDVEEYDRKLTALAKMLQF